MAFNVTLVLILLTLLPLSFICWRIVDERRRVLSYGALTYSWKGLSEVDIAKLRQGLWSYGERLSTRWNYLVLQIKEVFQEAVDESRNPDVASDYKKLLDMIDCYQNVPLEFAAEKVTRNHILPATLNKFIAMTDAAREAAALPLPLALSDRLAEWIGDAEEFRDSIVTFNLPPDPVFGKTRESQVR